MGLFGGSQEMMRYSDIPHDWNRLIDVGSRAGTQGYNLRMSLLPQILGLLGYSGTATGKPGREQWDIQRLASPDAYTDPVTELELENAQRLLEERMARGGQAPGGTSFAQLSSEFTRNAAAARGEARNQQFARLMGLSGLWEPLTQTAGGIGTQGGLGYIQSQAGQKASKAQTGLAGLGGLGSLLGTGFGLGMMPASAWGQSGFASLLGGLGGGSGFGQVATSGLRAGLLP